MKFLWQKLRSSIPPSGRALFVLAVASGGLLVASLVLQVIDPRLVSGVSTWLKPAKFAASVALTSFTLALLLPHLDLPRRGGKRALSLVVWLLAFELVLITVQAARGVPSHFNNSTRGDQMLFSVMGAAIVAVTIALGFIAVWAFRQRFADRALGWGIRLGFVAMLLGSAMGGLMTRPTPEQLASLRAGEPTPMVGGHAVGVPDGGPGLPLTRWSREGGDVRVPHFLGLHGLQVLPLAGWLLGRRRRAAGMGSVAARMVTGAAPRLTVAVGIGYIGLTLAALLQALRGQPLLAPDGITFITIAAVVGISALAALAALAVPRGSTAASEGRRVAGRSPPAVDPGAVRASS
jgi:hypothetical protein